VLRPRERQREQFLAVTYRELLGRPLDPSGRANYLQKLRGGATREDIVRELMQSDEYRRRVEQSTLGLPDLCEKDPSRYAVLRADDGSMVCTFVAETFEDFDWIEAAILENGFYEKPGVWELSIDLDKRVMAEIVTLLEPRSAIEVGCSSGGVLACLHESGVDVCGVDISTFAHEHAPPSIRDRIRLGDITTMNFGREFDVAFGLDIFEHVHPAKLEAFITALIAPLASGGFLFVNIPAYGLDEVFGEAFPMTLPEWRSDAARGRMFRNLEVDERGYPVHGHMIFATTNWWVDRFEAAGVRRLPALERAVHEQYDDYFDDKSPARRSFYVLGKNCDPQRVADLVARIRGRSSMVLASDR
jgi:Domain of unknown function (DUF4214)/Methyltransferase domain